MCGIAGQVVDAGECADLASLEEATARLRHRGPDAAGMAALGRAVLGHRRLSIIDLAGAAQPWSSEDGRFTLIFNGEIYNYLELRAELEQRGFRFRSQGDTEVLLNMYVAYGVDAFSRFNGMFALAIWDARDNELILARDRLGKKPLFYAATGRSLSFASEIHALRAFPHIGADFDHAALSDFLAYQFIPGARTAFRAIRKLPPAHYAIYSDAGLKLAQYWHLPLPLSHGPGDEMELVGELRELIGDAVRIRLRSDVPVGVFLSGGIDSALILRETRAQSSTPRAFTIGFGEASYDETEQAAVIARALGVEHQVSRVDIDVRGTFSQVAAHLSEPFADPSALPTWLLCRETRRHVTVALSGDGGDEVFGGYNRYLALRYIRWLRRLPRGVREHVLGAVVARLPDSGVYYASSLAKKLKLLFAMARRLDESPEDKLPQVFSCSERARLFGDALVVTRHNSIGEFGLADVDELSQLMYADMQTYLPDDILVKADRMSMAHSLEVRAPLLDYRVVEFMSRLPARYKLHGTQSKHLLRLAYRDGLPEEVLARKKHGFAVPIAAWLRGDLRDIFEDYVFGGNARDYLRMPEVEHLWRAHTRLGADNAMKLWTILMFSTWLHGVQTS